MSYKFLYQDQSVSKQSIDSYIVGDYFHEDGHVVASTLRGGLLSGCNLRYLFITNIGSNFLIVNEDYRRQGLYLFEKSLYYGIYDNYRVGQYAQVLLSPDSNLTDKVISDVIKHARVDFNQLLKQPAVPVLDTPSWHRRITHLLGTQGKRPHHKFS